MQVFSRPTGYLQYSHSLTARRATITACFETAFLPPPPHCHRRTRNSALACSRTHVGMESCTSQHVVSSLSHRCRHTHRPTSSAPALLHSSSTTRHLHCGIQMPLTSYHWHVVLPIPFSHCFPATPAWTLAPNPSSPRIIMHTHTPLPAPVPSSPLAVLILVHRTPARRLTGCYHRPLLPSLPPHTHAHPLPSHFSIITLMQSTAVLVASDPPASYCQMQTSILFFVPFSGPPTHTTLPLPAQIHLRVPTRRRFSLTQTGV